MFGATSSYIRNPRPAPSRAVVCVREVKELELRQDAMRGGYVETQ